VLPNLDHVLQLVVTAALGWLMQQLKRIARLEAQVDASRADQGRRIGDLEERVRALEVRHEHRQLGGKT
jgi:hypothetical protein